MELGINAEHLTVQVQLSFFVVCALFDSIKPFTYSGMYLNMYLGKSPSLYGELQKQGPCLSDISIPSVTTVPKHTPFSEVFWTKKGEVFYASQPY